MARKKGSVPARAPDPLADDYSSGEDANRQQDSRDIRSNSRESSLEGLMETVKRESQEQVPGIRLLRKLQGRVISAVERKVQSRKEELDALESFWASMSRESRREFLRVNINMLKEHIQKWYGPAESDNFDRAIRFVIKNGTWRFWCCCICKQTNEDCQRFRLHLRSNHSGSPEAITENVLPGLVFGEWAGIILNHVWKPVDTDAAMKMIEVEPREYIANIGSKKWPLVNDLLRENTLKGIQQKFQDLLKNKCLTMVHVIWIVSMTLSGLEIHAPMEWLLECPLQEMLQCISFLGIDALQRISDVLWRWVPVPDACVAADQSSSRENSQSIQIIGFTADFSCLVLENRLPQERQDDRGYEVVFNDYRGDSLVDANTVIPWMFDGLRKNPYIERKTHSGLENLEKLKDKICHLRDKCNKKRSLLYSQESISSEELLNTESELMLCLKAISAIERQLEKQSAYDQSLILSGLRLKQMMADEAEAKADAATAALLTQLRKEEQKTKISKQKKKKKSHCKTLKSKVSHIKDSQDLYMEEMDGGSKTNLPPTGICTNFLSGASPGEGANDPGHLLHLLLKGLWHANCFRDELLRQKTLPHEHVGTSCVVCALQDLFVAWSAARINGEEAYPKLWKLECALNDMSVSRWTIPETSLSDAANLFLTIYGCLHRSCPCESDLQGECMVHDSLALRISEKFICHNCGLESRHQKYYWYTHISANSLRTQKALLGDVSLDELLKSIQMNSQLICGSEGRGCKKQQFSHQSLDRMPPVFIMILDWETNESPGEVLATLSALSTEIDLAMIYRGVNSGNKFQIVSLICEEQCDPHVINNEARISEITDKDDGWIKYEDNNVEEIGEWDDAFELCKKRNFRPHIVIFEPKL